MSTSRKRGQSSVRSGGQAEDSLCVWERSKRVLRASTYSTLLRYVDGVIITQCDVVQLAMELISYVQSLFFPITWIIKPWHLNLKYHMITITRFSGIIVRERSYGPLIKFMQQLWKYYWRELPSLYSWRLSTVPISLIKTIHWSTFLLVSIKSKRLLWMNIGDAWKPSEWKCQIAWRLYLNVI